VPGLLDSDVVGVSDFDAGEVAGMRSAAWILLATAGINFLAWALRRNGFPPFTSLVDVFLGVQLLHLRHSWRAWALVRAGVGAALAVLVALGGFVVSTGGLGTSILGLGTLAYCGSLFLLLFGRPSTTRVLAGRLVFGLSVVLTVAAAVVFALPAFVRE
jgi:hypothetical protein